MQSDIGPILSNSRVAHGVLDKFKLYYKMFPISSKTTVAQKVLTQILSKRIIAHGVLHKF